MNTMDQMEMMPCEQVIARLWEYIDGALTEETASHIRKHLDMCARCFPQYDFQRAFLSLLRRNAEQPIPPELRHRVFAAILEEEAAEEVPEETRGRLRGLLNRLFRRE